ncbi:MAG TPA: hypothetical protein VLV50_20020 [Stellaceae bacterium]|nr:hypothetical protein [Stellaceae bacterium]
MKLLAMAAGICAVAATPTLAQGVRAAPLAAVPYPMTVTVPANGCAWSGVAYSDGAVIKPLPSDFSYFRCTRGSWQRFSSLADATREPGGEAEGSSEPPR